MSSTRRSISGEFHAERFCSSPEFEGDLIKGLPAAKRIALVKDKAVREVLWFIQWVSLLPDGLQQVCNEVATTFPERIGSPTIRNLKGSKVDFLTDEQVQQINEECDFWNWWREHSYDPDVAARLGTEFHFEKRNIEFYQTFAVAMMSVELPQLLKEFCLDPKADISKGVWFFDDLLGALRAIRARTADTARSRLAETAVTNRINETLDFWFRRRRMVLIEGVAGIGRSATTCAWIESHCGLARFIEVPSSGDDRSFFSAIARELGVARGTSMKAQEIKVRIEEMLATSELLLAFDESQYLWGQYLRPRKTPDRILWIKTIFDAGTPIALIAHSDFSKWQAHYVKQTLWTDEQFERRLNRRVILPAEHSREDMLKIARAHFPEGDARCWNLLAGYALGTEKKQASGVLEALESARYRAELAGRYRVRFDDIEAALMHDHGFLNPASATDSQHLGASVGKVTKNPRDTRTSVSKLPARRVDLSGFPLRPQRPTRGFPNPTARRTTYINEN